MVSENRTMARFMFDTNVFGKILWIQVPHSLLTDRHEYFVTHIQNDELNAAPQRVKNRLLTVFQVIPQQRIPTETAIWGISRFDMAKLGDGKLYNLILSELGNKKPLEAENNIKDALIGETAINNEIILVTDDKALIDSVERHGGRVMSFNTFQKALTTESSSG
jgi:predicted nucleic acid-binding protein